MNWLTLDKIFLCFLLYSFIGWLWETVLNIVQKRRFVDRGILNGPLCPIYGFGALIAIYALPGEHSILAVFLSSGFLACTLEYFTSWGIEKLFHMRLWDYSNKPFNINGRVYLNGFLFFAAGCTVVKLWAQPALMDLLDSISPEILYIVGAILLAILLVDVVFTYAGLISMNSRLGRVESAIKARTNQEIQRLDVGITAANNRIEAAGERLTTMREHAGARVTQAGERVQESASAFAKRVHNTFDWQQRRLIDAYPTMRSTQHHDPHLLEEIRNQIAQYRHRNNS